MNLVKNIKLVEKELDKLKQKHLKNFKKQCLILANQKILFPKIKNLKRGSQ